jgi:trans-feruloyl-CoA hydratase/vanillin synthase
LSEFEYKFNTIKVDIGSDGITWVRFNRPESRNAITPELSKEMNIALDQLAEDDEARVIVFTGEGTAFCAGMDLKVFLKNVNRPSKEWHPVGSRSIDFWRKIRQHPKITIAAINGFAYGGGLMPVFYCDFAVASDKALMGLSEINFGGPPGGGATRACVESVGRKWTSWIVLTGQSITGEMAANIGLVNFCVPHDKLKDEVERIANLLLPHHPTALEWSKKQILMALDAPGHHELGVETDHAILGAMFRETGENPSADGWKAFSEGKYKPGLQAWDFREIIKNKKSKS